MATFFLYSRIKRQLSKAASHQVVASAMPLQAGTQLAADQLTLVEWPTNLPLDGSFTKTDDLVGRILLTPIPAKEPVREQLLAGQGAAIGLTAKIPDGMRAVAVMTTEVNNVSGFLFPGSHVDVLVTFRNDAAGKDPMTTTVLQNIEVLSTGEKLQPDPSGKPQNVKVVTLLMNPDDAQKLMLANNQGTVQFVLRSGTDQVATDQKPVVLRQLQGVPPPPPPKAPNRTVIASQPAPYEVEIFDGTKKSVAKFSAQ